MRGATPLGTVTHNSRTGALVRFEATGHYAMVNADIIKRLDGRSVAAALGDAGRPAEMAGGKRVNVYLDDAALAQAKDLGDGNISLGIRRALSKSQ